MKILGLDIGDKKIGVAISDKLETISIPLTIIKNNENTRYNLNKLIKENDIKIIVVGIPYTLKGTIGFQAKKVISFIDDILKNFGLEIVYIDERFTSKISIKVLGAKNRDGAVDKISASLILDDYLNRKSK
jgi:putative Holliday junction resolvase